MSGFDSPVANRRRQQQPRLFRLADLIVLNSNPLENIRNTLDMSLVMKEGILYESDTLDETWPAQRPFGPYYWMDAQRTDERPIDQGVPRGR